MQAQMPNIYPDCAATLTLSGDQKRRYVLSPKTTTVIGRAQDCQVVLNGTQYPTLSRRHAEIRWINLSGKSGWQILDAGATNGTFVNGQRINGYHLLKSGDRLTLGYQGPEFIFECEPLEETVVSNIPSTQTINQATTPNGITQEEGKSQSSSVGNQATKKNSNSQSVENQPREEKEKKSEENITVKSQSLNLILKFLKWVIDNLTIPLIITGIGAYLTTSITSQLQAGDTRQKNLTDYFNSMKELTVSNQINRQNGEDLRHLKRSRTFWMLREVDGQTKGLIVRFLHESKLASRHKSKLHLEHPCRYFSRSELHHSLSLSGADLREIVLSNAWLPCIDLKGAYIQDANLERSNLRYANLKEISLGIPPDSSKKEWWSKLIQPWKLLEKNQETSLKRVNLRGANLRGAILTGADPRLDIKGAVYDSKTEIPPDLQDKFKKEAYYIRPFEDLSRVNLWGIDLGGAKLTGANLSDAILWKTKLNNAILSHANLRNADLSHADLRNADLSHANLTGANLIGINFSDANQIKSACNWETAIYKGHRDRDKLTWIVDEKANKKYIEQLKQNKASAPKEPVDCSRWEYNY